MSWRNDLDRSNKLFMGCVWPALASYCGGGKVQSVETLDDRKIARDLDCLGGIDFWQTLPDGGLRGIASRMQWPPGGLDHLGRPWNTFTVRTERESGAQTEYRKRLNAIANRCVYPEITVHAYVSANDTLLTCAAIHTQYLYDFVRSHPDLPFRVSFDGRAARFCCVSWNLLQDHQVPVIVMLAGSRRGVYQFQFA